MTKCILRHHKRPFHDTIGIPHQESGDTPSPLHPPATQHPATLQHQANAPLPPLHHRPLPANHPKVGFAGSNLHNPTTAPPLRTVPNPSAQPTSPSTTHLSIHNGTPAQPASHPPQHHSNTPIVQRNNQPHSADRPSPFFTNPTNARPTHACHTRARRYMPPLLTSPLTQRRHPLTTSNRCHTIEPTRTPGVTK